MNVVYCRDCAPRRAVAVGVCALPAEHVTGSPPVTHTDCGAITIPDDPRGAGETADAYLARIDSTYGGQYV